MSDAVIGALRANLAAMDAGLAWLDRSYGRCSAIGIKAEYTSDEFDAFENLTSRYARATDLIVNKVLRSIDSAELLSSGTVIDAANRAEKRGLVDSVSRLRELKDLRNEISHEYETDDLAGVFAAVLAATPELFEIGRRVNEYCARFK